MSRFEVEIKTVLLMDEDHARARTAASNMLTKLRDLGARENGTKEQSDVYLAHPSRDFASTDESLRVRSERVLPPNGNGTWHTMVTYKGPKVSLLTKARYERELPFGQGTSPEDALDLFMRLGFTQALTVVKERRMLELDGIEVSLDMVSGLGAFMELELVSDDLKEAEGRVLALLSRLGQEGTERRSYLELLLEKGLNR